VALEKLDGDLAEKERAFYEGKIAAAQFFARQVLPRLSAERAVAEATDNALMDIDEAAF
ncbi:MAG: acyl-CoA dehydrogenase C-terminal domain-containing protein, partial [Jiangellaceae bacterium]